MIDSLPSYVGSDAPQKAPQPATPAPAPEPIAPKQPATPVAQTPPAPAPKPRSAEQDIDDLPSENPKPQAKAPDAPKNTDAPKGPPQKIPELRKAYDEAQAELERFRAEKSEWTKRADTERAKAVEEAKNALISELKSVQEEKSKLDEKIRYLSYKESSEYAEKYQAPLQKAWEAALTDIDGLKIQKDDGSEEPVSAAHLQQLIAMPAGQAAAISAKLFGAAAPEVLAHRRAIIGLQQAAQKAQEEWKTKGSELTAAQARQQQERQAAVATRFSKHISDAREAMPDIFARPADVEAAAFWDKGDKLVGLAFRGEGLPEGITPEERSERIVSAQASVANRAAAFGAQRHALIKAQSKISELEAQLAGYKRSEPTPAPAAHGQARSTDDRPEDAIDRLPSV